MELINRRSFLKSIATACGAAVVCPTKLLKRGSKQIIMWVAPTDKVPTHCIKTKYKGTKSLLTGEPVVWGDEKKTYVVKAVFAGVVSETR